MGGYMADQTIKITPELTVDEAEQTVYNLDEVIQALQVGSQMAKNNGEDDPVLMEQIQFVLSNVESTRNKLHACLQEAGIKLDYNTN